MSKTTTVFKQSLTIAFLLIASFLTKTAKAQVSITLGANPTISTAAAAQTATLAYSATAGSPTKYSITWINAAGFVNVTNATLTAGSIQFAVPAGVAAGTYKANLTVSNGSTVSNAYAIILTVNAVSPANQSTSSPDLAPDVKK